MVTLLSDLPLSSQWFSTVTVGGRNRKHPILQMKKPRLHEVKDLAEGHSVVS